MRICNLNRNTILAEKANVAHTTVKRFKGLLGRRDFREGEALIIKPCNSIHTFFMPFPIDIIFVDSRQRIVKVISNMPPFRVSSFCFKASFAIELPTGTIAKTSSKVGDYITIEPIL